MDHQTTQLPFSTRSSEPDELRSASIHVTNERILGLRTSEILDKMIAGVGQPDSNDPSTAAESPTQIALGIGGGAVGGLRTYLRPEQGNGYWDFVQACPGLSLLVADAQYARKYTLRLPAERLVKVRVVCSGALYLPDHEQRLEAGSVLLHLVGGSRPSEYVIDPGERLRMVVVAMLPEALPTLGVNASAMSPTLQRFLAGSEAPGTIEHIESSAALLRIAREMGNSRDRLMSELRQTYLRGKAQELLCEALLRLRPVSDTRASGSRFRELDVLRLHEAKRILASELVRSPTVDQLSRMVGINRTKLKVGFRAFFGETVQDYRTRVRLEEAIHLIEKTDLPIAQVGRKVGMEHPSNFTQLIKRHFGETPLKLRRSRRASAE